MGRVTGTTRSTTRPGDVHNAATRGIVRRGFNPARRARVVVDAAAPIVVCIFRVRC